MRPDLHSPLLVRLPAIFIGVVLGVAVSCANAQTLPDIQRLMKQNQMPQALEKADIYISTKPKDAQGRFLKGLILTELGRPADAIAIFIKLTEDFPELPEPYNNLAVLYAQQKQYDKARAALEMAIRTHPSYSIAHENLGDVYAKLASQAYDKALQLDSSNAATQTKLSMIKELISTSSKPGAKSAPTAAHPVAEPVKAPAAETPKATPAPGKPVESAPEPGTAPKPPEAKPSETKAPAKAAPEPAADEADINKTVLAWAGAWSRKDVKTYLSYYAKDFQTPNGMPRKDWDAERHNRIDKPGKLQITLDDVRISVDGDKATVRFRQNYTSSTFKSSASKTLVLIKSGGRWLIQQERIG